ncbi:MAG: XRE family transcriptional regulator [Azospirillaceae bacterium]
MTDDTLAAFCAALERAMPDLRMTIDAPDDPAGETFVDLCGEGFKTSVSYRPGVGFGIFVSADAYGARPDEIYRDSGKAAHRIDQLRAQTRAGGQPARLSLRDMRALVGATQTEIATALHIKQPSVQRAENRPTVRLDTLAHYVAAMGGQLEMSAVFDDMEVRIEHPGLVETRR